MKQPSVSQLNALRRYAMKHGRSWKQHLHTSWENGTCVGELQQIRNEFGPTWLVRFSLNKDTRDIEARMKGEVL